MVTAHEHVSSMQDFQSYPLSGRIPVDIRLAWYQVYPYSFKQLTKLSAVLCLPPPPTADLYTLS